MLIPYGVPMIVIADIVDRFDVELIQIKENESRFFGSLEELEKAEAYMQEAMKKWVNDLEKGRENPVKNRRKKEV